MIKPTGIQPLVSGEVIPLLIVHGEFMTVPFKSLSFGRGDFLSRGCSCYHGLAEDK